jgi:hypothetical protein
MGCEGVNWIRLAQCKGQWRTVAIEIMNLRKSREFLD